MKISKKLLLIMLMVGVVSVSAQPLDWFQASVITAQINISSKIDLIPVGVSPYVQNVKADVYFVPKNSANTAIRKMQTTPDALVTNKLARFTWDEPSGQLTFGYNAIVERANNALRVRAAIPYPIKTPIPYDIKKYTEQTEYIDSANPSIIGQANYLAQEETDLFTVVSKIAMWTKNNVKYDLSTLTAEVSQPASWVLENRYGVCDEITNLFIAQIRALGIPAKFISGIAFTNSPDFPDGWGAHGWAEVYFPGIGWVPFDPTFGEFGWVDPGHIKLKESSDPREPTTIFEWKARDVKVEVSDLNISAKKIEAIGQSPSELRISVAPLRPNAGFGSYNAIMAEVTNIANYYVAPEFTLTKVTDMEIIGSENQQVILPPKTTKRIFWTVKVSENLNSKYQYELPLQIYTIKNETAKSSFDVGAFELVFSKKDIENSIKSNQNLNDDEFELLCAPQTDRTKEPNAKINCDLKNSLDSENNIEICLNDCENYTLAPQQQITVQYTAELETAGQHEITIKATSQNQNKLAIFTIVKEDSPRITIDKIKMPGQVNFGDKFNIDFVLSRQSVSVPANLSVELKGIGVRTNLAVGDLISDQEVSITVDSSQLYSGEPTFVIESKYYNGAEYKTQKQIRLQVIGVPVWKKMLGSIMKLWQ